MRTRTTRGFTLMEMMVVVLIVVCLAALAYWQLSKDRARANLASAAGELQSLLHQARQTAMGTGTPTSVLIYLNYATTAAGGAGQQGYMVVYRDACFDFFTAAPPCGVKYATFNPANLVAGASATAQSEIVDTMTLPHGVLFGPATGQGTGAVLAKPLNLIAVNTSCSFCGTTGGAVQFDTTGAATFYSLTGTTVTPRTGVTGGSISLYYDPIVTDAGGQRTILILSTSGAVQTLTSG